MLRSDRLNRNCPIYFMLKVKNCVLKQTLKSSDGNHGYLTYRGGFPALKTSLNVRAV